MLEETGKGRIEFQKAEQQPLRIAPSQEVIVKHTVVDTYEREALRLLLDRGYVVYKINGGKATLD